MSTITAAPRPAARKSSTSAPVTPADSGERRIAIRGLSWDLYDQLSNAVGERQHVYLAYDGKDLEIMTKGRLHEVYRERLGKLVAVVTATLAIRRTTLSETTWKRPEIARGLEADQCYYFTEEKIAADAAARARKSNDIADYPNPDLAVEVDLSESQIDRPAIYAALRVAEIWRFDGESVVIEHLGPQGNYVPAESSRFMPLKPADVLRWLLEEESSDELDFERRLAEWARGLRRDAE